MALAVASSCLVAAEEHKGHEDKDKGGHGHGHAAVAFVGTHSLDVVAQGDVVELFTGTYAAGNPRAALQHQRSSDGGVTWSKPVTVDAGMPMAHMPHRGMDAQIAAFGDKLVAVWMTPGTDAFGGGPMVTALSADGGKTWTAGPNPADDGSTTGHGFIDLAADGAGNFHLTWLDTRGEERGLRYARSTDAGKTWSANTIPDRETCECCWNTIVAGQDGNVAILYRDKNPRDMTVVRSTAAKDGAEGAGTLWGKPTTVGSFGWQFEGCPHVGGGLAMGSAEAGSTLHATVWTGQPERLGVYYLNTTATTGKGAGAWSQAKRLGDGTASHPDVAARGQQVAAVWNARQGEASVIKGATSADNGVTWTEPVQLSDPNSNPELMPTHAKVVATGSGFRAFWTQKGEGEQPSVWVSREVKSGK
ncbi:MAG TPA: hypothetical protein VK956_14090 [Verrucomicrobium sp.]|nr:hypothetical protein [Verrucomicrobium sp.]